MSKITIISGDLIEKIGGSYKIYANEGYEITSGKEVIFNAKEGIIYGEPQEAPITAEVIEVGFAKQEVKESTVDKTKKVMSLPIKGSFPMGEKVFLKVKTLGLIGKKLKVEVRQAIQKQLADKDQKIEALSAVEMTVGKITQSEDAKNKYEASNLKALENIALKEMVLEPKTQDEKKKWKDILADATNKKIKLYFHVEVLDAEGEVIYKGDDINDLKNFSTRTPFELTEGVGKGCEIDENYFFENYNLEFPKKDKKGKILPLSENKKNSLRKMFKGIYDYYSTEKRCCNLKHIAYMLATAKLETADTFNPIKEYGGTKYFQGMYDPVLGKNEKRKKMAKENGNRSGDGVIYIGRGFVQLTWRNNYIKMKAKFGIDLENFPDKALDHELAIKIMIYGSETGKFAGPKLEDYINDKKTDYYNARRIINGTDRASDVANYAKKIEKCLKIERCTF